MKHRWKMWRVEATEHSKNDFILLRRKVTSPARGGAVEESFLRPTPNEFSCFSFSNLYFVRYFVSLLRKYVQIKRLLRAPLFLFHGPFTGAGTASSMDLILLYS